MGKHEDDCAATADLTKDMLALIQGKDCLVALSALNFCMATLIHVRFDGAEGALVHSDQQTRFSLKLISNKHSSVSKRFH